MEDNQESDGFTSAQLITLRTFGFIIIALLSANVIFLVYNIIVYLIPLKIKSALLAQFYILASIITILRIVEVSLFVSWKYSGNSPTLSISYRGT